MSMLEACKEYLYPGMSRLGYSPVDGTQMFYSRVNTLCAEKEKTTIIDYGASDGASIQASRGWLRQMLLPMGSYRIGVDVDMRVMKNPFCEEAYVLLAKDDYKIPLQESTADVVVCDWVIEHLPSPERAFSDIFRVLKPGGWFCARTANIHHYAFFVANLVKNTRLERLLLNAAQNERESWPKAYRSNTPGHLKQDLIRCGFSSPIIIPWEPEPGYLMKRLSTLIMGAFWQRFAAAGMLPSATLLCFAQKPT